MEQENTFIINHTSAIMYQDLNNIPHNTEILEIEYLILGAEQKFENLPITLKEINIKFLKAIRSSGFIAHGFICTRRDTSPSKWIKSIFPKIPHGCKIYYYNEE